MSVIQPDHKHILFIPSWYFDKEAEGVFIHEHARMTAQLGHQVGLIYLRQVDYLQRPEVLSETKDDISTLVQKSFTLPKLPGMIWHWKRQYFRLYEEYCARFGTPDILHAHGYIAGIAACYLSGRSSVPYVITEHSTAIPQGRIPARYRKELRRAYRNASALIAVSAFLKNAMSEWIETTKNITVIGNPVDSTRYSLRRNNINHERIHLISIGSLEARKNYTLLFEALDVLRRQCAIHLVLIGTGPERKKLETLAQRLRLSDNITFAGYVSSEELVSLLMNADFFIASSTMENFGVAIVEALACGVPVISTPSGGPEEYLHTDIGRIAKAHTAEALCDAILDAISNNSNFNSIEIRDYIKAKFDFPVIGRQIDKVYQAIGN